MSLISHDESHFGTIIIKGSIFTKCDKYYWKCHSAIIPSARSPFIRIIDTF